MVTPQGNSTPAVSPLIRRANRMAAGSSRAWLTGVGLLQALREVARSASDVPIAMPGVDVLDEQLRESSADVIQAADLMLREFNGESQLSEHELAKQFE